MLQALGIKFLDDAGKEVSWGGGNLDKVATIDLKGMDSRLKNAQFIVACDVIIPVRRKRCLSCLRSTKRGNPDMVKLLDRTFLTLQML